MKTHGEVKQKIESLRHMGKHEVETFAQKLYMAKDDIDEKAFSFLQKAVDIRSNEIELMSQNPMAVMSELREGEV